MSKEIEVYVHGEGCDSKKLTISESATIAQLLEQAQKSGLISPSADGHPFKISLEDDDAEHEHHNPLHGCGVHHHAHVHCHRCQHITVTVTYNGESSTHAFKPSATGKKIMAWALDEFKLGGADAADKVLRFENKDELVEAAHIGTFAHFPKCAVQLCLTARVPDHERKVDIWIDNKEYAITPGSHKVAEIKKIGSVPQTYDLDEIIDKKLIPLKDDGVVSIKGCERFQSHPKDGASSNH